MNAAKAGKRLRNTFSFSPLLCMERCLFVPKIYMLSGVQIWIKHHFFHFKMTINNQVKILQPFLGLPQLPAPGRDSGLGATWSTPHVIDPLFIRTWPGLASQEFLLLGLADRATSLLLLTCASLKDWCCLLMWQWRFLEGMHDNARSPETFLWRTWNFLHITMNDFQHLLFDSRIVPC